MKIWKKLLTLPVLMMSFNSHAMLNPITDISWKCLFPMTIAGIPIKLGGDEPDPEDIGNPVCVCKADNGIPYIGLRTSFYEPSRLIDTVSQPWLFMLLGTEMKSGDSAKLTGALSHQNGSGRVFQQVHYYIFPVWKMLDMFYDIPCLESSGFDIPIISEVVPTWNNDILAMILNPEALLFGNPISSIACAADATSTLTSKPIDYLFWCMGSWGNAYPLAGSITSTDYLEANAGLAARTIYLASRTSLLWEDTSDGCFSTLAPVWTKSKYRLQLAQPVTSHECLQIGKDALLWGAGRHDMKDDNFLWTMFTKRNCCMRPY